MKKKNGFLQTVEKIPQINQYKYIGLKKDGSLHHLVTSISDDGKIRLESDLIGWYNSVHFGL